MVECKNINVGYASKVILYGLSFKIQPHSCSLICGENGSGKSSLIKSILGLLPILSGSINRQYSTVGYVPQDISVNVSYPVTLSELVEMGSKPMNLVGEFYGRFSSKRIQYQERVNELLDTLLLQEKKDLLISRASRGHIQKALVARALLVQPDFLVMDEPFSNLDEQSREIVIKLIQKHQKENLSSVCIADHILGSKADFYNRKIILKRLS